MSKPEISWFTSPTGDKMGYGYAAVKTIEALQGKAIKVSFRTNHPKVHISFIQPEWYQGEDQQFRIGYTPWESTVIPDTWPYYMLQRDEIWTTTQFCVDIFNEYKVNDVVRLVPHGIDPETWSISDREIADKFIFFHVGGPTERKGGQRVVDAFLDLFDGNDNVHLLMKSTRSSEARWRKDGFWMGNINSHPQVTVVEAEITEFDLAVLYHRAHCLVYPTNGEGFGLIPFQGIATGLPTICTDATGCADFAKMSVPLNSTPVDGEGIHLGQWVDPDLDDLRDKMRYVYDNWAKVKEHTMHSAKIIHTTQTWDHVAQQIIDILGDKIYEVVT